MIAGKKILITGATSGIGYAMAKYFHLQKAELVLTARTEEKLEAMEKDLGGVLVYPVDLSKLENIRILFDFIKKNSMKLDGIVHCAGAVVHAPIKVNSTEKMEDTMRLNFESFVEICKYASSKRYTNDNASIIAISSTASFGGEKGLSIYSASKAAINNFVKSAAREFASRNIRVNAVAPAAVEAGMYYQSIQLFPEREELLKERQPLGLIQPEYIVYLAEFLLSEKSRYISGTTILMGAGNTF